MEKKKKKKKKEKEKREEEGSRLGVYSEQVVSRYSAAFPIGGPVSKGAFPTTCKPRI